MQYRLSLRFTGLLVAAVLMISISVVGITIIEVYDSTKTQAEMLTQAVDSAKPENQGEWVAFLEAYTSGDSSPYYIRVLTEDQVIYSSDAKSLFVQFSGFKQLLFIKDILWTQEMEPYFYQSLTSGSNQMTILVDMEDKLDLVEGVISLTSIVTFLILIVGTLVTYRFAKTFSHSLTKMNQEISELSLEENQQRWLTEPESPQEVTNVSRSFNHLLAEQRESLEREKQFVTDASHELRTPLAAIRGHVNLIKRRGEKHPEVIPKSISFIDTESKRMETMVEKLLTLGRKEGTLQEINYSAIVQQTIEQLQVMMKQTLTVEIDEEIIMMGNEDHFRQIVRNLIENAMKYTEDSGEITVWLKKLPQEIQFEVADTGQGISDKDKQNIFKRFYRADQSRSSKISGSGIGLSIVQELIQFHGGTVEVLDNLPKGSRFIVKLPKR